MSLVSIILVSNLLTVPSKSTNEYDDDIPDGIDWPIIWWIPNSISSSPVMIMEHNVPEYPINQQHRAQDESMESKENTMV